MLFRSFPLQKRVASRAGKLPLHGPGIPASGSAPCESQPAQTSPTTVYPVPPGEAGTPDGGTPSVDDGYTATISADAFEGCVLEVGLAQQSCGGIR